MNIIQKVAEKFDRYVNGNNGFNGSSDPMRNTTWKGKNNITYSTLENMYRYGWLHKKIVNIFPDTALKNWIDFSGEKEDVEKMVDEFERLGFRKKLLEAARLARLHGGAIIIIGSLDNNNIEEELDLEGLRSVEFLNVLDRWAVDSISRYEDVTKSNYGEIEKYRLTPPEGKNFQQVIHASRVIRIDGEFIPKNEFRANSYWHDSVLNAVRDAIKDYIVGVSAGAKLTQDFILKTLKIKNLLDLVAEGNDEALQKRIELMIRYMSSNSVAVIDGEEEFDKQQSPVTGFIDLIKTCRQAVAAAADVPESILFGQDTGTLAGASETTRNWYDKVESYRTNKLDDAMDRFFNIMINVKTLSWKNVDELSWNWKSLYEETDKDKSESRNKQAQTDVAYINAGVLDPLEVRESRFPRDGYSFETTIDPSLNMKQNEDPVNFEDDDDDSDNDNEE